MKHPVQQNEKPVAAPIVLLMLLLLGGLLYFKCLGCYFLWDDYTLILRNASEGAFQWDRLPSLFAHRYFYVPTSAFVEALNSDLAYYRPITVLVHGLTFLAFGPAPAAFHAESLLLHVGNAFLLFLLLSNMAGARAGAGWIKAVAPWGALFFLIHPRNVETVCLIANQTSLLCSFFTLLSLWAWTRKLASPHRAPFMYGLSLLALLLAMLSKESAYPAPLLHLLLVFWGSGNNGRKQFLPACGFVLLAGACLLIRHQALEGPSLLAALAEQASLQGSLATHLGAICALLFHQLFEWLWPLHIHLFQYPFSAGDLQPHEVLVPAAVAAFVAWRLRHQKQLLLFCIAWFVTFYLPSSNVISIGALPGGSLKAGAHHLYPAHAGLAVALAAVLLPRGSLTGDGNSTAGKQLTAAAYLVFGLLLSFCCVQSIRFTEHYKNEDTFYQTLAEKNPAYNAVWENYAWHQAYLNHKARRAESILLKGVTAMQAAGNEKGLMTLKRNLIVLYLQQGQQKKADILLQQVKLEWLQDPRGKIFYDYILKVKAQKHKGTGAQSDRGP